VLTELGKTKFGSVLPLLHSIPRDPMLYSVLEGNRVGRVFVDHISDPTLAFIWTNMEYSYLVGDSACLGKEIVNIVEQIILPFLDEAELDFLSIFPFGVLPADVQAWFPARRPVSFGVSSYIFERDKFMKLSADVKPLPSDFELVKLDTQNLNHKDFQGSRDDILFCWDSLERFDTFGLGYCIYSQQYGVVSVCYAIGYGAGAYHINIWTHHEHRQKGFARNVAIAFLTKSLQEDKEIYWINDVPNIASRLLAESLGFTHNGILPTVDVPVHPYRFHLGLAEHFSDYLGLYREAGELYDMAFSIRAGNSAVYYKAALAWDAAGDLEKAEAYRQKAAA